MLFVLAAEALLRAYAVPTGLIPTPSKVAQSLWAARTVLLQDAYYTFVLEALLGFVIGTLLGLVLALLAVRFRFLERGVLPYAALLSSVPIVALAPVVIKAVGLGWPSKTIIVAVTVLFPVVINAVRGLQSAQPMHLDLMHSYAASPAQIFREVTLALGPALRFHCPAGQFHPGPDQRHRGRILRHRRARSGLPHSDRSRPFRAGHRLGRHRGGFRHRHCLLPADLGAGAPCYCAGD